jgi:hypothetical protein
MVISIDVCIDDDEVIKPSIDSVAHPILAGEFGIAIPGQSLLWKNTWAQVIIKVSSIGRAGRRNVNRNSAKSVP